MPSETRTDRSSSVDTRRPAASVRHSQPGVFRKEGEYWAVGYGGKFFRLKGTKGLGYIAHLLHHPTVEFHALDLMGGIAGLGDDDEINKSAGGLPRGAEELERTGIRVTGLGDAGEMLDEQAKVAYRRRLSELQEELDEAKGVGNAERAEKAENEIDALTRELSRAVGLGGRNRRAVSASERARQSVTKTVKAVLERIMESDATLGEFFSRCIKTGNFCSYQPDPDLPIAWEFAETTLEQKEDAAAGHNPAPVTAEASRNLVQARPVMLEVSRFPLAARTEFVGRENESNAIRAMIDRAGSGQGSVVMLWDGPGVGKTRLAMEMAEYASRNGFQYSVGHCYERDEPYPYLPFAEIIESNVAQAASLDDYHRRMGDTVPILAQIAPSLRRIFPDLPQPVELPGAQQRGYVFQGVSQALARAARLRPQLLVLEDLHWADESTLALVMYLARRIAPLPVVIIATYRSGYSKTNPALARTLEEMIRIGVRPLKLGGLSKGAVAQMLRALSRRDAPDSLLEIIFEESQGYPFFVEEVYRHLVEELKLFDAAGQFRTDVKIDEIEVPENVRLIISRRLERLDESEKQVLAAAAVIGRSFSFQLLTSISHVDIDELFAVIEKAQQMGIVVPSFEGPERPFTFKHELVRQTLLAGISGPRRQRLHARVADAIELGSPGAVNEYVGEITDHLLKAGSFVDGQKVVRWLTLAGKKALEAAAFEEARRHFESALAHQGAVDPRLRAELLASIAMAERGLDQWDAAIAHSREVLESYINLDDRKMIGRSFTELAAASIWAGRFREATETAERGLSHLHVDAPADRVRLFAILAQALAAAGVYQPADEALREALKIASELSAPKLEARLLGVRSIVNIQFFRLRETVTDGLASKLQGGSDLPPWQFVLQLLILHQVLLYLGRLGEALSIADELEPLARKIGQSLSIAFCLSTRAWIDFGKVADLAKLEAVFQRVRKSEREASFAHLEVVFEVQLALVDFFRGNWTSALLHAEASRRQELGSCMEGFGVGTIFRQMAYAGDRNGALEILNEKRALLPNRGQTNTAGSWLMLPLVIEGLVMLGERAQAGDLYPLVGDLLNTGAVALWPISHFTRTIAAIAAAAARQWEAAEEQFQCAMQDAESFPNRLEQAEIRRFHAMMLLDRAATGDRERAQTLLREAIESYTEIGMTRHIEIARALLN